MSAADPLLSREACEALAQRVRGFARDGGETDVGIESWHAGELRWARNRVTLAGDRRSLRVVVTRTIRGATGQAVTNQLDDVSLEAVVRAAGRAARFGIPTPVDLQKPAPPFEFATPAIWSDATYDRTAPERGAVARALIARADAAEMVSAGYLEERGETVARFPIAGAPLFAAATYAQCSMTVRDVTGTGSGWAGLSSYDLASIDAQALAIRALEKARAARNPVALEPGRYTVILEPQAVHDLVKWIIERALKRRLPEVSGQGPFVIGYDNALGLWRSKLGLQVADERITISHDPMDPALGVVPFTSLLEPIRPVTWIDRGILTALADDRSYALETRNDNLGYPNSNSYRMSGGEASVEEMIASTQRGLLVTRFSNIDLLDGGSLLLKGLTRDGLWLIENGKISKAVKNFWFTESPLFVLNNIEALGVPTPVFNPGAPAIVPPLKARDFSFTSTVDAI